MALAAVVKSESLLSGPNSRKPGPSLGSMSHSDVESADLTPMVGAAPRNDLSRLDTSVSGSDDDEVVGRSTGREPSLVAGVFTGPPWSITANYRLRLETTSGWKGVSPRSRSQMDDGWRGSERRRWKPGEGVPVAAAKQSEVHCNSA